MPPPTIEGNLKVHAPAFIRKLGRANHWGQPEDPVEKRIASAVTQIFRNQTEPEISVYLVRTNDDLRRVAIGYNAGRKGSSLHETIVFLPILKSELDQLGIQITKTPANLKCDYANELHHDLIASDEQLQALCLTLIKANRQAGRCTESTMREAEKLAIAESCKSVPNVMECGLKVCGAPRGEVQEEID